MFDYPDPRGHRRHGPLGYTSHRSYRPWLRDEFAFRCIYCLKREQWGQATGEFDIDHFMPQALSGDLTTDYENLVYACRRCNGVKQHLVVDDPFDVLTAARIKVMPDGFVWGVDTITDRLILALDLNSPRLVEWRIVWLRIADLARDNDFKLYARLTGLPDDLPELWRLRPPGGNTRPEGIDASWAALAKKGELPAHY